MRKRHLILLVLFAFVAGGIILSSAQAKHGPSRASLSQIPFKKIPLSILTKQGPLAFTVELANTPEQMELGLMFRASVPDNTGMLFDFVRPHNINMWMKNTEIPLDMLFIDTGGTITYIAHHTEPQSLATIAGPLPSRYVLELGAGVAEAKHIAPGDHIVYTP